MLPANLKPRGLMRLLLTALIAVGLLLSPFHSHSFAEAQSPVAAFELSEGSSHPADDTAPAKPDSGCPMCCFSKKLSAAPKGAVSDTSVVAVATVDYLPLDSLVGPRSAIFGVFRPPSGLHV